MFEVINGYFLNFAGLLILRNLTSQQSIYTYRKTIYIGCILTKQDIMGGWKLEVAKMALYITFPVALFYYFNQPEYFEEWVVKTKREIYPPESKSKRESFEQAIQAIKKKQELALLAALEDKEQSVK